MLKVVGASWVQTTVSFFILLSIFIFGIFLIVFVKYRNEDDGKYAATVFWNPYTEGFDLYLWGQNNDPQEISLGAARAYYQPNMQETGWAVLEIETNGEYLDKIQAFAAGMLEGSLSWQHIYWQWTNTIQQPCLSREKFCGEMRGFLTNNTRVIRKRAAEREKTDYFWHQVALFYIQLDGIEFGWTYEMKKNKEEYEIPKVDFLWMNMISDFKEFEKLAGQNQTVADHSPVAMTLLKLLPKNNSEFLLAHASSGLYNSMLRIQKKYKFNYHLSSKPNSGLVPGRTISFTSYPASIHSQDDFYQITSGSAKITVTGTSLNPGILQKGNTSDQVLLGPRIMAANRLSTDGRNWSNIVKMNNNIFGSKQWMHILTKSREIHFWVLEQTHSRSVSKNETSTLHKQGFWIHCGIPHYLEDVKEHIYHNQNANSTQHRVGSIAVETERVLKMGQHNITNLSSLINLIRGPDLSIVGRTDLHITNASYEPAFQKADQYSLNSKKNESDKISPKFINYIKDNSNNRILANETLLQIWRLKNVVSVMQPLIKSSHETLMLEARGKKSKEKANSFRPIENKTFLSVNGIIDLKVTKNNDKFLAAAGPPFNLDDKNRAVEPFQWSKSRINYLPHNGHSDVWNYQPVVANFVWT